MDDYRADLFRCDVCTMTFMTESGVRRHMLCTHARRYHRGRPSSPVPPVLLDAAVQRARMAQANSRQRRRVRVMQQTPPESTPPVVDPPAAVSEADELLGDLLQGWPDDQLLMPVPAVQSVVVREVETQHELSWQDAATSTDRVNYNVGVQAGFPALSGPVLLADPEVLRRAAHYSFVRPDLPPDRVVESLLTASSDMPGLGVPRELLQTIVAATCRAQRTMARRLLRQLTGGDSDGEADDRRGDFLAAMALLEETAERSVGPFD